MKMINKEKYDEWKAVNTDPYGSAVFRYAERWANLMEARIECGDKLEDIAHNTSIEADTEGISGYMYGVATSILAQSWKYGDKLRVWHNAQYGHTGEGVVNPAILTIKREKE